MTENRNGQAFLTGLFGGALLGTIAGVIFAPQIYAAFKQVRRELADAISDAGDAATGAYREATIRATDAVDDLHDKGRGTYGKVLSVIIKGAEEVEGRATEAQAKVAKSAAKAATRRSS
jgi:gas vesicle protein